MIETMECEQCGQKFSYIPLSGRKRKLCDECRRENLVCRRERYRKSKEKERAVAEIRQRRSHSLADICSKAKIAGVSYGYYVAMRAAGR